MMSRRTGLFLLAALCSAGCDPAPVEPMLDAGGDAPPGEADAPSGTDGGGAETDAPITTDAPSAPACIAHDVRCTDTQVTDLNLFDVAAAEGLVVEEGTTPGEHTTYVDARAMPSMGTTPTVSYTYARFTEDGLEQVVISDEDAFTSTEWDIAFRRFVVRLNGGVSGPGCVRAARIPPSGGVEPTFETVTEVPALELFEEAYYTESGGTCTLVSDGSGLPGAPDTILAGYWRYTTAMCLGMTDAVYVIELGDGRHVKLTVLSYYTPENQALCDADMAVPVPSGSANFRVRWAYLD